MVLYAKVNNVPPAEAKAALFWIWGGALAVTFQEAARVESKRIRSIGFRIVEDLPERLMST